MRNYRCREFNIYYSFATYIINHKLIMASVKWGDLETAITAVAAVFLLLFIILFALVINLHVKIKGILRNRNDNDDDDRVYGAEVSRPQTNYVPEQQHDIIRPEPPEVKPKPFLNPRTPQHQQYQPEPQLLQQPSPSQPLPSEYRRSPSNDYKSEDFNNLPDVNNRWRVDRQNSDRNTPPLRDSGFRNQLGGQPRKEIDNRFNYTDPRSLERLNRPNSDIGFRGMQLQQQNSRPREPPMGSSFSMEPSYPRR